MPQKGGLVVIIPVETVCEPRAIGALLRRARLAPGEAALEVDLRPHGGHQLVEVTDGLARLPSPKGNATSTGVALFTPEAVTLVRDARGLQVALWRLARARRLRAVSLTPHFCERVKDLRALRQLERDYIAHLSGTESYFTKRIRRVSVPVTQQLLRLPITANHVTLGSFVLSAAAGVCFGLGAYWAGLFGAALYYASTVLDCCDGEVARVKLCESPFGCWLETATDYALYLFVWTGLTVAAFRTHGPGVYTHAAGVALAATLLVFGLVAYMRHRVTGANPGQLDETLAARCAREGRLYRFSGWARQWIKRSTLAHALLVLAVLGRLPVLLVLWALAASMAFLLGLPVSRLLMRPVRTAEFSPAPTSAISGHV